VILLTLIVPAALTVYVWEKTTKDGMRAEFTALTGCWLGFAIVTLLGLAV
jgi:threonine/homoserine/homoserine lactone efflux protein